MREELHRQSEVPKIPWQAVTGGQTMMCGHHSTFGRPTSYAAALNTAPRMPQPVGQDQMRGKANAD